MYKRQDLFGLITGEDAGGVWTRTGGAGGVFDAATGSYTPAVGSTTSTFEYTVPGTTPCIDDVSEVVITINSQLTAGTDGALTVCDSSTTAIDLFGLITGEDTGGVWTQTSGTGGTFDAATGSYTPAVGSTTSTFEYTVSGTTPCIDDVSEVIITINGQLTAGTDGSTMICDNDTTAIDLFGLIGGEDTGGIWTRTGGTGGTFDAATGSYTAAAGSTTSTFEYTVLGTAPCINDVSVATVTINPTLTAGVDGASTICDSSTTAIDLFGLITGEDAGGVWTRTSGAGGVFDAATGSYTPAVGATSSTFEYRVMGTAPCADDISEVTITINAQLTAGTDGATTICDNDTTAIDLFGLIGGEDTGGTWTRTSGAGGTFDAVTGSYTAASGSTTSTFEYTVLGTAPCINDVSEVTITINVQLTAGTDGVTTICDDSTTAIDLFGLITGEDTGGTWVQLTGTGGVFDAATGSYTPVAGATSSTFEYTVLGTAPCSDASSIATITINRAPVAGTDGGTTICDGAGSAIDLYALITGEDTGGVWTQTSGTGGTFDAAAGSYTPALGATTSTFEYRVSGTAPCVDDVSIATVTVSNVLNAGLDGATTICDNSTTAIDLYSLITGEDLGGVWVQTGGTGGVFDAATGIYTPALGATTSTFEYTVSGVAPCVPDTSVATVTINRAPVAGVDGGTTICDDSTDVIDLYSLITGEDTGGVWTRTGGTGGVLDAAVGSYTPAVGATTSTFEYTVSGAAPCVDVSSFATITINRTPVATVVADMEVCDDDLDGFMPFDLSSNDSAIMGTETGVVVSYHASASDADSGTGSLSSPYTNTSSPQTIYVRLEDSSSGCYDASTSFNLIVNTVTSNTPSPLYDCDEDNDGFGSFNLEDATAEITGGDASLTVTYHETLGQARDNLGALSSPYANIASYSQTLYIRVEDATTGCSYYGTELLLNVIDSPALPEGDFEYVLCDYYGDTTDGFALFDLTSIEGELLAGVVGSIGDYSVSYHLTEATAISGTAAIGTPTSFINTVTPEQIIYARVTSSVSGCVSVKAIILRVDVPPVANDVEFSECDTAHWDDMDEYFDFDLTNYIDAITGGATDVEVSFYEVLSDAEAGSGSSLISDPTSFTNSDAAVQTIYVRVYNPLTGCYDVARLTLRVLPNPTPSHPSTLETMELCDGDVDGDGSLEAQRAIFDLTIWETLILTGDGPGPEPGVVLTYYRSEDDAHLEADVIATPTAYENEENSQTIYVRATNSATGCYTVTWFEILVPVPSVSITGSDILCVDGNGVPLAGLPLPVLEAVVGPDSAAGYTYQWELDGVVLVGETNSTLTVSEAGTYTVTISTITDILCINRASHTVNVSSGPIEFEANVTTVAFDDSHQIVATATGVGVYVYSLDNGEFVSSGVFDNVDPGLHTITIEDEAGCGRQVLEVLVIDYPKFFTPNGDGFNDTWQIIGIRGIPISQLYIFDRYGKLLKQLDPDGEGWDGTYNGVAMPATDYWFKIIYIEGTINPIQKEFKAHFSLKR